MEWVSDGRKIWRSPYHGRCVVVEVNHLGYFSVLLWLKNSYEPWFLGGCRGNSGCGLPPRSVCRFPPGRFINYQSSTSWQDKGTRGDRRKSDSNYSNWTWKKLSLWDKIEPRSLSGRTRLPPRTSRCRRWNCCCFPPTSGDESPIERVVTYHGLWVVVVSHHGRVVVVVVDVSHLEDPSDKGSIPSATCFSPWPLSCRHRSLGGSLLSFPFGSRIVSVGSLWNQSEIFTIRTEIGTLQWWKSMDNILQISIARRWRGSLWSPLWWDTGRYDHCSSIVRRRRK